MFDARQNTEPPNARHSSLLPLFWERASIGPQSNSGENLPWLRQACRMNLKLGGLNELMFLPQWTTRGVFHLLTKRVDMFVLSSSPKECLFWFPLLPSKSTTGRPDVWLRLGCGLHSLQLGGGILGNVAKPPKKGCPFFVSPWPFPVV